jgi:hypothetical protein
MRHVLIITCSVILIYHVSVPCTYPTIPTSLSNALNLQPQPRHTTTKSRRLPENAIAAQLPPRWLSGPGQSRNQRRRKKLHTSDHHSVTEEVETHGATIDSPGRKRQRMDLSDKFSPEGPGNNEDPGGDEVYDMFSGMGM